jgi:hypothetical protein
MIPERRRQTIITGVINTQMRGLRQRLWQCREWAHFLELPGGVRGPGLIRKVKKGSPHRGDHVCAGEINEGNSRQRDQQD